MQVHVFARAIRQADERNYISDADLARMLQYVELLGMPRDQSMTITRHGRAVDVAGFGQPAMMRAWLIQALTGRRAAKVLLMDFGPLTAIPGAGPAAVPDGGMVARLRYQPPRSMARPPRSWSAPTSPRSSVSSRRGSASTGGSARTGRCATCSPSLPGTAWAPGPGRPATTTGCCASSAACWSSGTPAGDR